MRATSSPDRIHIAFDDDRLVDHAGLLLPATLAGRLGLRELADAHLDLGVIDAVTARECRGDDEVLGTLQVLAGRELGELRPLDALQRLPVASCSRVLGSGNRAWRSRRATAPSRRLSTSDSRSCARNSS